MTQVPRLPSIQPGSGSASSGEALPHLSERELFWAGVFVCVPGVILAVQTAWDVVEAWR